MRQVDVSMPFYPDIFIDSLHGRFEEKDKNIISTFLQRSFGVGTEMINDYQNDYKRIKVSENADEIVFLPREICSNGLRFQIIERIQKKDLWQIYYIIESLDRPTRLESPEIPKLRIDSGCVSGQIYDDTSCDCLDQLHHALKDIHTNSTQQSLLIHVPTHDGRGFGTAPKAETEIYKRGGIGRVHTTLPLDTVASAKLLYESDRFDLRSYDGIASLLKRSNIYSVLLLTDNHLKFDALKNNGIQVMRQKTETNKPSCKQHLDAKKKATHIYFND